MCSNNLNHIDLNRKVEHNGQFDDARSEAFASRVADAFNSGALALMISIGYRTGLLDKLAELPWSTSQEIADACKLNERYVREWLGAVTVGGVVDHDPDTNTYRLPAEHAAWLTRKASPNNLGVYAQYIGLLGTIEDKIIECFHNGGGVPYEEFHRFHDVMAEDSGQTVLPVLIESIFPLAPGLPEALERGIDVLDVGCGVGKAMIRAAEQYPNSRFRGYDFSEEAIGRANAEAQERGLTNVQFEVRDVVSINEPNRYDLITAFDAIHDQIHPDKVLRQVYDALKPDGVFLMQDIAASSHVHNNLDHPMGVLLYTVSCMHCMTVSLAHNGAGLGAMWGEELARKMLDEAGFEGVRSSRLPHDIQNTYFVITKDRQQAIKAA